MKRFDFSGAGEHYHILDADHLIHLVDVGSQVDDEVYLWLEVAVILLRETHVVQTNIT